MLDSLTGYVGGQIPLGVGPASLAILAFLPEAEANAVIETNAGLYQNHENLSADKIRAELPIIRERGFAVDKDELIAGISAFAIPILPQGRDAVAAIAINMTSARLPAERLSDLVTILSREIRQIEEALNPLEGHRIAPIGGDGLATSLLRSSSPR